MNIAVVSVNLGDFDKPVIHVPQTVQADFIHITDKEFPLRDKSMTHRLQARIVKTHMWDFAPGYDIYVWIDSSCQFKDPMALTWLLGHLADNDIVVFKHPQRNTVQEEADYLKQRLAKNCPYITPRYENELIDEQLAVVNPKDTLYASTIFAYWFTHNTKWAMQDWWYHISRYHSIDQLSFPHALRELQVEVINKPYDKNDYIEYVRNK